MRLPHVSSNTPVHDMKIRRTTFLHDSWLAQAAEEVGFGRFAGAHDALERFAAEDFGEQWPRQPHDELFGTHLRRVGLK